MHGVAAAVSDAEFNYYPIQINRKVFRLQQRRFTHTHTHMKAGCRVHYGAMSQSSSSSSHNPRATSSRLCLRCVCVYFRSYVLRLMHSTRHDDARPYQPTRPHSRTPVHFAQRIITQTGVGAGMCANSTTRRRRHRAMAMSRRVLETVCS